MDVSLVTSERIDFRKSDYTFAESVLLIGTSYHVNVDLRKISEICPGSSMLEKSLTKKGCSSSSATEVKRRRLDHEREPGLKVEIWLRGQSSWSTVELYNNLDRDNTMVARLEQAFGGAVTKLRFEMELTLRSERQDTFKFDAKDLALTQLGSVKGLKHRFRVTEAAVQTWKAASKISGELTLCLNLTDAAFHALQMESLGDSFSTCRAIRADVGGTDALIIAGDGAQVRCHKAFLSAHSPVFKAMFQSSMKEGITGSVELPDMTQAGVEALLDYLYCWDLKEICKSSQIAVELLVAADKYNIPRLQNSIQDLILLKKRDWLSIPAAIHLLLFAKNRAPPETDAGQGQNGDRIYKAMEAKSVTVLRSKTAEELNECSEYQKLFEDPKMGKELCTYFMLYPFNN